MREKIIFNFHVTTILIFIILNHMLEHNKVFLKSFKISFFMGRGKHSITNIQEKSLKFLKISSLSIENRLYTYFTLKYNCIFSYANEKKKNLK